MSALPFSDKELCGKRAALPVVSYHKPCFCYLLLVLGSYNHKVGSPEIRVWYEPKGRTVACIMGYWPLCPHVTQIYIYIYICIYLVICVCLFVFISMLITFISISTSVFISYDPRTCCRRTAVDRTGLPVQVGRLHS